MGERFVPELLQSFGLGFLIKNKNTDIEEKGSCLERHPEIHMGERVMRRHRQRG